MGKKTCIGISNINKENGGYADTWIRPTRGERVARIWLEIFAGPPRMSMGGAPYLSMVQRLMVRHTGLEVLESTFIRAARATGYLVETRDHTGRPPVIGVNRLALRAVEQRCERNTRERKSYWCGQILAAFSDLPEDQEADDQSGGPYQ